ncbi:MAG TPA: 50S ribosomal protein L28 [Patescibacteria group bacterium]|nr:50S ribosomal protein L28 [Patescibacteria group bacterium]
MSKSCIVNGKTTTTGMNVSHSKRRTKRLVKANLLKKRLVNPASGRVVTVVVSARGLRTLKKWDREGKSYDLVEMKRLNALI